MKDGRVWRAVVVTGLVATCISCGGKPEPQPGSGRGRVEEEFNRCQEQEKYGDAKGCWHAFLDRFGDVASSAEKAYAAEHVSKEGTAPAAPEAGKEAPSETMMAGARNNEGLHRLNEKGSDTAAGPSSDFPPQRVSYQQCYQGFRVTGNSEQDVIELGNRCGAPCGMIPFSGVMADSQAEDDNVDTYGITLRGDRCYRFFAVGAASIEDLDSAIADNEGNILLRDVFTDSAPILGPEKPFCPPSEGRYKFVISVAKGNGNFHFQVWQGPRQP